MELVSLGTNEASLWPPGRFLGGPGGLGTACPWAFQLRLLKALYLGYLPRGQAWVPGPELPLDQLGACQQPAAPSPALAFSLKNGN